MAANQEEFVRTGLRAITSSDDLPMECTICVLELQAGQNIDQIRRCGHIFHKHCLLSWINSQNTQHSSCPNYRQELFPTRHPSARATLQPGPNFIHGEADTLEAGFEQLEISVNGLTGMMVALRERNEQLESALRRHSVDIPQHIPRSDPQTIRAMRTIDGPHVLPACVMPRLGTGAYTTVEARWRTLMDLGTGDASRVAVNDLWAMRSSFVRDVERLERLRMMFSLQAAPDGRPETNPNRAQLLVEYGTLLDRLTPLNSQELSINTSDVIDRMEPQLRQEVELFSLLRPVEEVVVARTAEVYCNNSTEEYSSDRRYALTDTLLRRSRLDRFVSSGVYHHYMASDRQRNRSSAVITPPRQAAYGVAVQTPTRSGRQREAPSTRPTGSSRWQPGMSPSRSRVAEAESMRVSWSDGSPRGANAEALLDPDYLRWRQEQGRPSTSNSPIAMAVGGAGRNLSGAAPPPSQHLRRFVHWGRGASVQIPDTLDMNEPTGPLQTGQPYVYPVAMKERRETYEAFFSEIQHLGLGPETQAEASRLFPRHAVYDRSVQADPIAQCALMLRVLRHARSSTPTMGQAGAGGEVGGEETNAEDVSRM